MGNAKKTKQRNMAIGIGSIIGIVVVIALVVAVPGLTNPPGDDGTTGAFDVIAWDGGRGIELPASSFTYTLYGVEGNDLTDFAMYDVLGTPASTGLGSIDKNDLDTDYDQFVVKASGLVVKADWDQDDPKVEPIDETYDHGYYERWFVLNGADVNYLVFYETPNAVGLNVLDTATFAAVTAPIVAKMNITIIVASNGERVFARYVTGANYANENNDAPEFVITFANDVALSDVLMNGATKTRVDEKTLRFTFGVLSTTPSFFSLKWRDDLVAGSNSITQIKVGFGSTVLDTLV